MNEDWLALPAGIETPAVTPPVAAGMDRRVKLAVLKKRLTIAQRRYANCLLESRGNTREALRLFRAAGYKVSPATLSGWRARPYFRQYVDLVNEEALERAGISPVKVLLTTDALAEYGAEVVVKRNKYGQALVDEQGVALTEMRDPHLTLKANEFMGRHFRLWGDEDKDKRVVVNIVDLTGEVRIREEPLEAEVEVVDGEASTSR